MRALLVYADGACRCNGVYGEADAQASYAVYSVPCLPETSLEHLAIRDACKPLVHIERAHVTPPVGRQPTNNLAEASALLMAASWLHRHGTLAPYKRKIRICMDSELIIAQVTGLYRTRAHQLLNFYRSIHNLIPMNQVEFRWIPGDLMKQTIIAH